MHGYGQYCPIALGAEVFAERWTPIIIRNLMIGCERFGEVLDGAPGLPRSVLSQRLRRLEAHGVIIRQPGPGGAAYQLTEAGRELGDVCLALGAWGARWREVLPAHIDPYLALWMLARLIEPASLPQDRIVVRFDLTDRSKPDRYWVVASRRGNEVCVRHPGFDEDAIVTTDAHWLVRWHSGTASLAAAQKAGGMRVAASPWLTRTLSEWGRLSPFAASPDLDAADDADRLADLADPPPAHRMPSRAQH
jgi:DNA-binding HxlR family transcriptional regulator